MVIRFAVDDAMYTMEVGGRKYILEVWDTKGPLNTSNYLVEVEVYTQEGISVGMSYIYDGRFNSWHEYRPMRFKIDDVEDHLPREVINKAKELAFNKNWKGGDPQLEAEGSVPYFGTLRFKEASINREYLTEDHMFQRPYDIWYDDDDGHEVQATLEGYGVEMSPENFLPLSEYGPLLIHMISRNLVDAIVTRYPGDILYSQVSITGSPNYETVMVMFALPEPLTDFMQEFNAKMRNFTHSWRGGDPAKEAKFAQHAIDIDSIYQKEVGVMLPLTAWIVEMYKDATPTTAIMGQGEFEWMIQQSAKEYSTWINMDILPGLINIWFKDKREAELFAGGMNRHFRHREHGWRGGDPQREASMQLRFALDTELIEGEMPEDKEWETFEKTEPIEAVKMEEDFVVDTLEGEMGAHEGDWLAKDTEDELWPIDGDIFDKTYAPMEE